MPKSSPIREAAQLRDYHDKVYALMSVDDFSVDELRRHDASDSGVKPKRAASSKKSKRKTTSKKAATASKKKVGKKQ